MGKSQSKKIDSAGTVNNNVIVANTEPVEVRHNELVYLCAAMLVVQIIQVLLFIHARYKRGLKRTYTDRANTAGLS